MQPAYHSCQDAVYAAGIVLSLPAHPSSCVIKNDRQRALHSLRQVNSPNWLTGCGAGASSKRPCTSQHPALFRTALAKNSLTEIFSSLSTSEGGEANVDVRRKNKKCMSRRTQNLNAAGCNLQFEN
jgi:hypothetical protein